MEAKLLRSADRNRSTAVRDQRVTLPDDRVGVVSDLEPVVNLLRSWTCCTAKGKMDRIADISSKLLHQLRSSPNKVSEDLREIELTAQSLSGDLELIRERIDADAEENEAVLNDLRRLFST